MSNESLTEKRCTKCGETKPVEEFYKTTKIKSGYSSHCKVCIRQAVTARHKANPEKDRAYKAANADRIREQERARNAANPEAKREYNRAYQAANADHIRELKRAHRIANAEAIREYNRAYHAANREKIADRMRAQRGANPEKYRQRMNAWRIANPEKVWKYSRMYYSPAMNKARHAANPDIYAPGTHSRRAKRVGASGHFTSQQIQDMRQAQNGICAYCQRQYHPNHLTIDHIIPLSRGGSNDISNICLACSTCNSNKHGKLLSEWTFRWYEHEDNGDE